MDEEPDRVKEARIKQEQSAMPTEDPKVPPMPSIPRTEPPHVTAARKTQEQSAMPTENPKVPPMPTQSPAYTATQSTIPESAPGVALGETPDHGANRQTESAAGSQGAVGGEGYKAPSIVAQSQNRPTQAQARRDAPSGSAQAPGANPAANNSSLYNPYRGGIGGLSASPGGIQVHAGGSGQYQNTARGGVFRGRGGRGGSYSGPGQSRDIQTPGEIYL